MLYSRKNYLLMGLSVLLIIVGFVLMSGGASEDPAAFNPAIFSAQRIVVAPAVCLSGFVLMVYAILAKPAQEQEATHTEDEAA